MRSGVSVVGEVVTFVFFPLAVIRLWQFFRALI